MDKFLGNDDEFVVALENMGERCRLICYGDHIRVEVCTGVVMRWWYGAQKLEFGGPFEQTADFRARFIKDAGSLYRRFPRWRGSRGPTADSRPGRRKKAQSARDNVHGRSVN